MWNWYHVCSSSGMLKLENWRNIYCNVLVWWVESTKMHLYLWRWNGIRTGLDRSSLKKTSKEETKYVILLFLGTKETAKFGMVNKKTYKDVDPNRHRTQGENSHHLQHVLDLKFKITKGINEHQFIRIKDIRM